MFSSTGERSKHLAEALARARAASTHAAWLSVIQDFRWSTAELDSVLVAAVFLNPDNKDLLEQFQFAQELQERHEKFYAAHPDALKVRAIFYPKQEFVSRRDDKGLSAMAAKGIPWLFYLVRTPITDSRYVPTGYEWQLHDITAPIRAERTVKTSVQLNALEALEWERRHPGEIEKVDPPEDLFDQLNKRYFFPEGMLYWTNPISGTPGSTEMTAPRTFGDWLQLIGMTVAIIGALVFAPFSLPAIAAAVVGAGLSIAGGVANMEELDQHGLLTQGDVDHFYWSLALDVVTALTAGFGRVFKVAEEAGNLARAAWAGKAWCVLRTMQVGMDVVNVAVMGYDLVDQIRAIQNSSLTPEQKQAAIAKVVAFSLGMGLMQIAQIRSGGKEVSRGARLTISGDPVNPRRLVADILPDIETAEEHLKLRGTDGGLPIGRAKFTNPHTGEHHTYALWPDGRITRCSDPPCLTLAQSVLARTEELNERMLSDSKYRAELLDLLGRSRKLREDAQLLVGKGAKAVAAGNEALLSQATKLEAQMAELEHGIGAENRAVERTGREEALRRWGPEAVDEKYSNYYRWVRDSHTGELKFLRRDISVPEMEFDPVTRTFKVSRPLFVPVSAERLKEIHAPSETGRFKILATVSTVEDLRKLRPASEFQRPLPKDWVVVQISDDNLVRFMDEPIPHGAIFEFPDGSRVWRTPENTIRTEGAVRPPIGRRGFEQSYPLSSSQGKRGPQGDWVPLEEATGVEFQRSHPRGQGTGFELYNHIPNAPTYVNQQMQARGIELFVSELQARYTDVDFRLVTEHKLTPLTRRQDWIDYHLYVAEGGTTRKLLSARITTDVSNPAAPAKPEITFVTRDPLAWKRLQSVDMDAARAELTEKIRKAMQRARQQP
jgi:hypothetical protein